MMPVLIAKLIKTKFAKIYSHSASVAHIFGNVEYLSSYQIIVPQLQVFLATQSNCDPIKSLCFGCTYFWQLKVIELLLNDCASFARIFGNSKPLSSYQTIVIQLHVLFIGWSQWALIKSLCFGCSYFLRHEVTKLIIISMCFGYTYFLVILSHWDH